MSSGEALSKLIDEQALGIVKSLGMPTIKTTTVDEELEKSKKKKIFATKVFAIIDDISAADYAEFINSVLDTGTTQIVREVESWTKDGELIRVIDYMEAV